MASDYVEVKILLKNPPLSNNYSSICSSSEDSRSDSFSPPVLPLGILLFWGLQLPSPSLGFYTLLGKTIQLGSLRSLFPTMILTIQCFSGRRFSPVISFASSFLAISCFWEPLQVLSSDHHSILRTVPFSSLSPSNHPPYFYRKLFEMTLLFTPIYTVQQMNTPLFPLQLRSLSLTLNAAKFSILFCLVQRQPQTWWSFEMEEVVMEKRKVFAFAHKSGEKCHTYIYVTWQASTVIAKANGTRHADLSLKSADPILCSVTGSASLSKLPLSEEVSIGLWQLPEISLFRLSAKGFV